MKKCSKCRLPKDENKTKLIRGLLCRKCNSAIGLFDDDIEKIKAALAYLQQDKKKLAFGAKV